MSTSKSRRARPSPSRQLTNVQIDPVQHHRPERSPTLVPDIAAKEHLTHQESGVKRLLFGIKPVTAMVRITVVGGRSSSQGDEDPDGECWRDGPDISCRQQTFVG